MSNSMTDQTESATACYAALRDIGVYAHRQTFLVSLLFGPWASEADGSKKEGQLCCQQYACPHQNDTEWVVGRNFEHLWRIF